LRRPCLPFFRPYPFISHRHHDTSLSSETWGVPSQPHLLPGKPGPSPWLPGAGQNLTTLFPSLCQLKNLTGLNQRR
uniref:Uncharacterized protein n=1 Tax=Oryctolagus cuniculus TaxID=9986 RepID=A0A5F9CWR3_RABIT